MDLRRLVPSNRQSLHCDARSGLLIFTPRVTRRRVRRQPQKFQPRSRTHRRMRAYVSVLPATITPVAWRHPELQPPYHPPAPAARRLASLCVRGLHLRRSRVLLINHESAESSRSRITGCSDDGGPACFADHRASARSSNSNAAGGELLYAKFAINDACLKKKEKKRQSANSVWQITLIAMP